PSVTAAWYVAGATLGGLLLGGSCALAAWGLAALDASHSTLFGLATAAAVVGVVSDAGLGWSLPDHPRQVNETWLGRYRRWIYAAGFGAQIGTGFATYIMTAAVYLTAALAVLSGPAGAVLTGVVFGAVRGSAILVTAGATSPDALRRLLRRI